MWKRRYKKIQESRKVKESYPNDEHSKSKKPKQSATSGKILIEKERNQGKSGKKAESHSVKDGTLKCRREKQALTVDANATGNFTHGKKILKTSCQNSAQAYQLGSDGKTLLKRKSTEDPNASLRTASKPKDKDSKIDYQSPTKLNRTGNFLGKTSPTEGDVTNSTLTTENHTDGKKLPESPSNKGLTSNKPSQISSKLGDKTNYLIYSYPNTKGKSKNQTSHMTGQTELSQVSAQSSNQTLQQTCDSKPNHLHNVKKPSNNDGDNRKEKPSGADCFSQESKQWDLDKIDAHCTKNLIENYNEDENNSRCATDRKEADSGKPKTATDTKSESIPNCSDFPPGTNGRVPEQPGTASSSSQLISDVNISHTEGKQKVSRPVQCNLVENFPGRSIPSQEIYSKDGREYISRDKTIKKISYSAKILNTLSQAEIVIHVHGEENLLTANKNNFVARIQSRHENELNFSESFQRVKLKLLRRIKITKVLEDSAMDLRNESYRMFKEILKVRIYASPESVECAEDLLQLSNIYHQKLKWSIYLDTSLILNEIIQNKYISTTLKQSAVEFLKNESCLSHRNQYLPEFSESASPVINDFPAVIYNICSSGIMNHKDNLKKCPTKFKRMLNILDIDYLPTIILLSLSRNDIKLFLDLVTIANQQTGSLEAIIPHEYIMNIWNNFYAKVKRLPNYESIKELGPLTNSIFLFLFKSFCELTVEISNVAGIPTFELLVNKNGEFSIMKNLKWPKRMPINKALEEQYSLIFRLMNHFEPGKYSSKKSFKYKFLLMNNDDELTWKNYIKKLLNIGRGEGIKEDRFVWLCVLDCGLSQITSFGEPNENIKKLTHSLQELFAKFLQNAVHDRHESFRIAVHNITKLAGHICNYISTVDSDENEIDRNILDKQTELISKILAAEDDNTVTNHFANLVDVYKDYWTNRESILAKISKKCPCKHFEDVIKENIFLKLLQIMHNGLHKCVALQEVIKYFRQYNEFLQHFKGIEFEWIISEKSSSGKFIKKYVKLVDKEKKYYQVTNAEKFLSELKEANSEIPEHCLITIIMELLCIVSKSLDKQNWSDSDQLKAAGDILLAIGHSLLHFKDQVNYVDFDNFVRNCTFPFSDVLMNSQNYLDFKSRLDNVENFYLYTNKQREIGVDNALNLCVENSNTSSIRDFVTTIDTNRLKECHTKYTTKYSSLENYIKTSDVESIIEDMREDLDNVSSIDKWTSDFKQNVIPSILANLAAIWTIIESKDLVRIGKRIEPHIIQILCIFRLLGVDKQSKGIDKHLAQVLTGQGKSIVLGLLSSLLAVTGHDCIVACYSDYLAKRDQEAFETFFDALRDFNVKSKISYKTIDDAVSDYLYYNINGKETGVRTLVTALILDALPATVSSSNIKQKSSVLLIDEVDVFFSETFWGNFYRAGSAVPVQALQEIQPKIWEIVDDGVCDKEMVYERTMEYINGLMKDTKYEDFKEFIENTDEFFKTHLDKMIATAIEVSESKNKKSSPDYRYKIDADGCILYRDSDGLYKKHVVVQYYKIFNYFLLKETDFDPKGYDNYGYLQVFCGSLSYASLPKEFPVILGVSGTLTTLHKFEKEAIKSYGINTMSVMPSFFGDRKLKFSQSSNCTLLATEAEWLDRIYESVNDKIRRAVIVFFESEKEMKTFEEKFRSRINRLQVLTGNEEKSKLEWYISESGVAQTVTLATRLMGRGVDYKSNDMSVEEKGGVHVIQTFFSLDVKEEVQIQGRTARKDNEGSYELILCHEHLDEIDCLKKGDGELVVSYRDLCGVREKLSVLKGEKVAEKIKKAAEEHELTMKFLKSFDNYTPMKRKEYFSRYPFVEVTI